ncbi:deoxyribonuclease IV [Methylacidimicrobium tartarophylax]|uniref:Probable endonuclease 4 n=1 Tax=Methylacidimicrobium tartarophylax TaxID=1041768 RepID=A0A5E6MMF8_9BACT|nr:deoxyribonuclease IV [Methylacidimicrobium tartarophylax]VVM06614.1 Endonuclease 4 [Methylacidimicrobium tartarophylax]
MRGDQKGEGTRRRASHPKAEPPPAHPLAPSELSGRLFGAHVSVAGGFERAVERAIQCGFSAAQLFLKNCRQWKAPAMRAQEASAFRRAASSSGIFFFGHAGYLINLASPSEPLATQSLESLRDEITRAELLGLPFLVLHPGTGLHGEEPKTALFRLAHRLRLLFPADSSEPTVRIALETMAGQGNQLGGQLEQLAWVLENLADPRRFGLCLDTAHLWAAGYPIATRAGYRHFTEELERLGLADRIWAFHLNDSAAPFGSRRDRHEHLGRGTLGLAAFQQILQDPRWSKLPMVLETPKEGGMEADCRNLRAILPFLSPSHSSLTEGSPEKVRKLEKSTSVRRLPDL